jgi:hypothetical protein
MTRKGGLTGVHVAVERERVGGHPSVMMSPGPTPSKALPIDDEENVRAACLAFPAQRSADPVHDASLLTSAERDG